MLSVKVWRLPGEEGLIVRQAGNVTVVRAMLFLVTILVLMSANLTVGWLIDARVLALVTLTIAMVAALMFVYFDWRATMRNRARAESHDYGEAT